MKITDFLTDGVVIALMWIGLEFLKQRWNKSKNNAEIGKIDVETFVLLRTQVGEMEEKIIQLRDRIDVLEQQIDVKDTIIKQLDTRLSKVLIYLSGLLRELDSKGVQYTPPEPGVLDTDPKIKAIK